MRAWLLFIISLATYPCAGSLAFLKAVNHIGNGLNDFFDGHDKLRREEPALMLLQTGILLAEKPVLSSKGTDIPASTTARNTDLTPTESQMQAMSGDWLFHVKTTSCLGVAFDNTTDTLLSRVFMPLLFMATLWAVTSTAFIIQPPSETQKLLMGPTSTSSGQDTTIETPEITPQLPQASARAANTRLWHVDFARICAVMCVIFEHCGGEDYTHRNGVFGLWWALPYLYMSSGIGLMMSKSSMFGYVARLVCLLLVGVGANWIADVSTHRDWRHDFGNTIFQMFFVVMLIAMCIIVVPLRQSLRRRQESPDSSPNRVTLTATLCWATIAFVGLWYFSTSRVVVHFDTSSEWGRYYAPIFKNIPIMLVQVGGTLFFTIFCHPRYQT
jgi:hypothetical protein